MWDAQGVFLSRYWAELQPWSHAYALGSFLQSEQTEQSSPGCVKGCILFIASMAAYTCFMGWQGIVALAGGGSIGGANKRVCSYSRYSCSLEN